MSLNEESRKIIIQLELERVDKTLAQIEGLEKGWVEGWAEGRTEANRETARRMKADGLPIDVIVKYTGLTAEDIAAL